MSADARALAAALRELEAKAKPPKNCQKCGCVPKCRDGRRAIQGHHHRGYDRPLDVVWLCARCHYREDRMEPAKLRAFVAARGGV